MFPRKRSRNYTIMKEDILFSIVIPFKDVNDHVRECIQHCEKLDFDRYEIILLPDDPLEFSSPANLRIIPTGPVYPSVKRNLALENTSAEFVAFLDSDAYPVPNWLSDAYNIFKDSSVGGVGGPNHIPPGSPLLEQIGTKILYSRMGVGAFPHTTHDDGLIEVKEMASSNLIIRTELLKSFGGFHVDLLTAEDARVCYQIQQAGYKLIYSPKVTVFHHRRAFPWPFLRSIYVYGRDKSVLTRELFSTEVFFYYIPSLFVTGLIVGGVLSLFSSLIRTTYFSVLAIYLLLVTVQSLCFGNLRATLLGIVGIPLTHIVYGIGFIKGLFGKKLAP